MNLPGVKELLFGIPGCGKTTSLGSLVDAGLEVFCQFTEPSGMFLLNKYPPEKLHWNYVAPAQPSWEALIESAVLLNTFSNAKLQEMQGIGLKDHAQFIDMLKNLSNFKCERTGKAYGAVDTWGPDRVLVLDGLSGLNLLAMSLKVGTKPLKTLPDWGAAMDLEEGLINRLTLGCNCHFVLIAHADRETDQVIGGSKIMPSALGRKLPQTMGRYFDDVIFMSNEGGKFLWSTVAANVDSKARLLPLAKDLKPSFVQIIEAWKKLGGSTQPQQ